VWDWGRTATTSSRCAHTDNQHVHVVVVSVRWCGTGHVRLQHHQATHTLVYLHACLPVCLPRDSRFVRAPCVVAPCVAATTACTLHGEQRFPVKVWLLLLIDHMAHVVSVRGLLPMCLRLLNLVQPLACCLSAWRLHNRCLSDACLEITLLAQHLLAAAGSGREDGQDDAVTRVLRGAVHLSGGGCRLGIRTTRIHHT
jgi:hypothetical protein